MDVCTTRKLALRGARDLGEFWKLSDEENTWGSEGCRDVKVKKTA
jgi:hypothetical protein